MSAIGAFYFRQKAGARGALARTRLPSDLLAAHESEPERFEIGGCDAVPIAAALEHPEESSARARDVGDGIEPEAGSHRVHEFA